MVRVGETPIIFAVLCRGVSDSKGSTGRHTLFSRLLVILFQLGHDLSLGFLNICCIFAVLVQF